MQKLHYRPEKPYLISLCQIRVQFFGNGTTSEQREINHLQLPKNYETVFIFPQVYIYVSYAKIFYGSRS